MKKNEFKKQCEKIMEFLEVPFTFTSVGCEQQNPLNLNETTNTATYYIIGYDACSIGNISNDSGEYRTGGYLFVSENLTDTLVAYNLPNRIFNFSEELMPKEIFGFNFFPEEYRLTYPVQMTYRIATEEEIQNVVKPCITYYLVLYNIEPVYIIITSISKININHEKE
jgi:hypothetical protein